MIVKEKRVAGKRRAKWLAQSGQEAREFFP
jgi:hypothetical protein